MGNLCAHRSAPPAEHKAVGWEVLEKNNHHSTDAIIAAYKTNRLFQETARLETKGILKRDKDDHDKLQRGVELAVAKGVLEGNVRVEPVTELDVLNKDAADVAERIVSIVCGKGGGGSAAEPGQTILIQGLSGTGKGTLVNRLKEVLPNAVTWSNGNVFRAITLLAATHFDREGVDFDADKLTPELLASLVGMLEFGKFNGKYDTKIEGLGLKHLVSDVENTELKSSRVTQHIPAVANLTQGEVILFAASAIDRMRLDGYFVLVEGREATLNYIRTPHRFNLTLSDKDLIGRRRLAQKMMGSVLGNGALRAKHDDGDVGAALDMALDEIAKSWEGQ